MIWRAAALLAGANTLILLVTAAVGLGLAPYGGTTLAAVGGPVLSVVAWVWLSRAEAAARPGDDLFHAWLDAMMLTAVALGATVVSAAVITVTGRK